VPPAGFEPAAHGLGKYSEVKQKKMKEKKKKQKT